MTKVNRKNKLSIEDKLERVLVKVDEQPYKVPSNWCWSKLDGLVSIATGKKDANYGGENGEYTFFTCAGEPIRCDGYSFDGEALLLPGNGANVGQVFYYNGKFEAYQRTYVLQPLSNSINVKYLYYQLQGFWEEYNKDKQYGSATNYIKMSNFLNYKVPIAPIPEQQRIVERVEGLLFKLNEVEDRIQEALDSVDERKASILKKAFDGSLTVNWREQHHIKLENWKKMQIKECCIVGSGGTPSRKTMEYYKGNIPWIKTGEINWNYIYDSEEHISEDAVENSSAKLYEPGAVLVAMYGMGVTRGRAAILEVSATTNQAVCVLRPKSYLYNKFLYYYFMCNYWDIRECAVGGNQLNLSGTIIGKLDINIPTLDEQEEISRILDVLIQEEKEVTELMATLLTKIESIRKSILVKTFRGELGTNNPDDESAVNLLKQIIAENL